MDRPPPMSTPTDSLCPYPSLFRSSAVPQLLLRRAVQLAMPGQACRDPGVAIVTAHVDTAMGRRAQEFLVGRTRPQAVGRRPIEIPVAGVAQEIGRAHV